MEDHSTSPCGRDEEMLDEWITRSVEKLTGLSGLLEASEEIPFRADSAVFSPIN